MIKQRFRNSVKKSYAYPEADCDSDHNLIIEKLETRLKKVKKLKNNKPKYDLEHLDGFKLIIDSKFNERKAELKEKSEKN